MSALLNGVPVVGFGGGIQKPGSGNHGTETGWPRLDGLGDRSTFNKARRTRKRRKLGRRLQNKDTHKLLTLAEVTRRLGTRAQHYVGVRTIPLSRIVGTLDREGDFDRDFLPRRAEIEKRWRQVERAFPDGHFPPIIVYEVDGSYFVVDGHHRVAIARQRGMDSIDADVTRLESRTTLPPEADTAKLIRVERGRMFNGGSGFTGARSSAASSPFGAMLSRAGRVSGPLRKKGGGR